MSAVNHLHNNFKQLQKNPIVGANAMFCEDDIMKWYCTVVGSEGSPYENVPIRFVLEFDNQYPNTPPKAFFDTHFAYYGGAQMKDDKGRIGVCLDIFGNFGMVHTEWKNNVGSGWSPSYTVSTILITMQCLLSDSSLISTQKSDVLKTKNDALAYKCNVTGHDGSDMKKWVPHIFMSQEEIDEYKLQNGIDTTSKYDPLEDNYVCYVTKNTKKAGAILGFGVNVENSRIGILSSTCEYLSKEAFDSGTRQSTLKKPFKYWLPILIKSSDWKKIKLSFTTTISNIATELKLPKNINHNVIKICSSLMNSLVVEIMNAKNNVTANDKFINGYFSIYRLLKQYAADNIECIEFADSQLQNFTLSIENRSKQQVNNLGEFLIYLTIGETYNWNHVKNCFLEETDARNVFWYAVGNYNNPAKYPELIDATKNDNRCCKVFDATPTSRNLIVYQVEFSKIARNLTLETMDSNFGMAPGDIRNKLKNMYSKVDEIINWNDYFTWLELPIVNDSKRCTQLQNAIKLSNSQGYTGLQSSKPKKSYNNKYKKY